MEEQQGDAFDALSPANKVAAVLAALNSSTTVEFVLETTELDMPKLSDEERASIEAVFLSWQIADTEPPQYKVIPREEKEMLFASLNVDEKSVSKRLTKIGMKMACEVFPGLAERVQARKKKTDEQDS
jgi:hypothetical protein